MCWCPAAVLPAPAQPHALAPQTLTHSLTHGIALRTRRQAISSRPGDPPVEVLHSLGIGKERE